MSKFFFIFILISVSIFGQKKQFETAIKNGRSSGGFYQATVANDKAVKETDVLEYATKNNYLLRNITYQMVNRFGDKFKGVKSFDFLPVSEIPQVIYETKYRGNVSYKELTAKKKEPSIIGREQICLNSFQDFTGLVTLHRKDL